LRPSHFVYPPATLNRPERISARARPKDRRKSKIAHKSRIANETKRRALGNPRSRTQPRRRSWGENDRDRRARGALGQSRDQDTNRGERFDYFVLNDQVVLVDPDSRRVVDIIEDPR